MLFSLLIFMVMVGVILQMILTISTTKIKSHSINPMEWELFITNLRTECKTSVSTVAGNSQVHLSINGKQVLIEKYKSMLRRRVNGSGHEILLHGVKAFEVVQQETGIYLEITDQSDRVHTAYIYAFL